MTPRRLRSLRYCVIDNDRAQRRAVAETLRAFGARTVIEETTPGGALRRFEAIGPDVIVLDWFMPEMSAADFIEAMHRQAPPTMIPRKIVMTGSPTERMVAEARRLAVDAIVRRPFPPRVLLNKLLALPISDHEESPSERRISHRLPPFVDA